MIQYPKFQAYQTVRIIDDTTLRKGQVGTYVGPAAEADTVEVKFEGATPTDPQVIESFHVDGVEGV